MAIRLREGRWCLSRIVDDGPGGFTTAASRDLLAPEVQNYYPPMNAARTGFSLPFALVRLVGPVSAPNADTRLIPPLALDGTLRDLSSAQRTTLRNQLEEWMTGYSFRDWDGATVVKQTFSGAGYTLDTPLRQILLDLYGHLGHSEARPRPTIREPHNTEHLDPFTTDPYSAPRWTNERGAHTWDSGNSELDLVMSGANPYARYSINGPGSIEHESQVTNVVNSSLGDAGSSAAVRCDDTGADDCYFCWVGAGNTLYLGYIVGGTRATLTTFSFTYTSGNFVTIRLAASGAAGANVVLDIWRNHNGSSKPSDPGWYGPDGTPDHTYTHTAADRLDATSHSQCGIGARSQGSDYDTRCCFWKSRAITDRGGPVTASVPGVAATGAAGDVTVSGKATVPLTGVAGTGEAGTLAIALNTPVAIPGAAATGHAGEFGIQGMANVPLTGAEALGLAGDFTISGKATVVLSGVSADGLPGAIVVDTGTGAVTAVLGGVAAVGAAGDIVATGKAMVPVSGVAGIGAAGDLTIIGAALAALPGVAAIGAAGTLAAIVSITVVLPGVSAAGDAGLFVITGRANVPLTGAEAQGLAGVLTVLTGTLEAPSQRTIQVDLAGRLVTVDLDTRIIPVQGSSRTIQ